VTSRPRRTEALSRERIVEAAVALLDEHGEAGLTFKALTRRLATGAGAIYHHVANKDELLSAAAEGVVAAAVDEPVDVLTLALRLYDALDAHPWLATQLATELARMPWGPVTPRLLEAFGQRVRALGVPEPGWFTATTALMHYVLGAAGQNAANSASARHLPPAASRAELFGRVWGEVDPADYPFTRAVVAQVRDHDDREQFLAGVDLILAGISALHPPPAG
jgi:AcrR family transcriptional regulator